MADIQKAAPMGNLQTMKNVIEKYSSQIQQLIPKHVTGERIVQIALTALTRQPDLLECDPRTVLAGIIQASILGLELHSPLHHASLVKFWNGKAKINEATLMIEYRGLIELVMRGGETNYVEAQPVYANDDFDFAYGTEPFLHHKPQFRTSRGELIGAYSYAKLKNGDFKFHFMPKEDIEKRRNVSKAKESGPWMAWTEEMYTKTPLRHLCKQLRQTTELAIAMEKENQFDSGEISSVVQAPGGLSMDFLSMNIEAKTLDATTNLRNRLEAKKENAEASQNKQDQSDPQPTQGAQEASQAAQADTSPKAASDGLQATKQRLAEAKAKQQEQPAVQAQPQTQEPEQQNATAPAGQEPIESIIDAEYTGIDEAELPADQPVPEEFINSKADRLMQQWDKEAKEFEEQKALNKEVANTPEKKSPAPEKQQQAPLPTAPTEELISKQELEQVLTKLKQASVPPPKLRGFLDSLTPRVTLPSKLTKSQLPQIKSWIDGGSWKQ